MAGNSRFFITVDIPNSDFYSHSQHTRRASVSHAYFGGFFFFTGVIQNAFSDLAITVCQIWSVIHIIHSSPHLWNCRFVSKYRLELPKKEEMQRFIEEQIKQVGYHE